MSKQKRGDCGTCHWFVRGQIEPPKDGFWAGSCLVNPPVAIMGQQQVNTLGPNGPQGYMQPVVMGILPQTQEDRRCSLWRPNGMMPDLVYTGEREKTT